MIIIKKGKYHAIQFDAGFDIDNTEDFAIWDRLQDFIEEQLFEGETWWGGLQLNERTCIAIIPEILEDWQAQELQEFFNWNFIENNC